MCRPCCCFCCLKLLAVTLWLTKDNLFYLLNFSYIGACLALGTALFTAGKRYARHFVQLAVGSYMLLYLGVISRENMQIEGFWYYLFLGVFEAATIHYAVAKILGPLLFGRGWCGYACWTAMVLDFLPYKQPQKPRREKLGVLRYVMFALSLALVSGLFPDEGGALGADHVLAIPRRECALLHCRALRLPSDSKITGRSASICVPSRCFSSP